jgi:phosphate transport system substrate-binding protein
VGQVPGIAEFVAEYTSDKAIGEDGYLADKGLIPLPKDQEEKTMAAAKDMTSITADMLK